MLVLPNTRNAWAALACAALISYSAADNAGRTPSEGALASERRGELPAGDARSEGIAAAALDALVAKAQEQGSEALVVVRNGKLLVENYFGHPNEPIGAMSASKSFVGLAFGFLVAEGRLASLDEPVSSVLPSFASDARKAKITYRHLLTNSSGIDPSRASTDDVPDIEAHAERSQCLFEPGALFQYSNGGVDLLALLASKLAGVTLDRYLDAKLFAPLGIPHVAWQTDTKGIPFGAGEMYVRPIDIAKVGVVLASGGKWEGATVLPPSWIDASIAPSIDPTYGFLWWRLADATALGVNEALLGLWRAAGVAESTITKVTPLVGKVFPDFAAYTASLKATVPLDELVQLDKTLFKADHVPFAVILDASPSAGIAAIGWLGQFLVVLPEEKLVAVRMRRWRPSDSTSPNEVDGFPTFSDDVRALVQR